MILRRAVASSTILLAIAAAACGGRSPTQPTAPSSSFLITGIVRERLPGGAPGLPIKGVKIDGPSVNAATGDDGRYRITIVGGTFDLTFSKEGYASAAVHVDALSANRDLDAALDPVMRTLTGTVTDASSGARLLAASVQIMDGSNKGRTSATDANGEFRFDNVWGEFDLSVAAVGYQPATMHAAVDRAVTRADVRLSADTQVGHALFTGTLCTVAPPLSYSKCQGNSFPYPVQAHHLVTVPRPGTMTFDVTYAYVGDYYWNSLSMELRCGTQLIAERRIDLLWGPPIVRPDNTTGPFSINVPQACNYEITLFNYIADRKGGDWTTYRMDVSYPK